MAMPVTPKLSPPSSLFFMSDRGRQRQDSAVSSPPSFLVLLHPLPPLITLPLPSSPTPPRLLPPSAIDLEADFSFPSRPAIGTSLGVSLSRIDNGSRILTQRPSPLTLFSLRSRSASETLLSRSDSAQGKSARSSASVFFPPAIGFLSFSPRILPLFTKRPTSCPPFFLLDKVLEEYHDQTFLICFSSSSRRTNLKIANVFPRIPPQPTHSKHAIARPTREHFFFFETPPPPPPPPPTPFRRHLFFLNIRPTHRDGEKFLFSESPPFFSPVGLPFRTAGPPTSLLPSLF